MIYDCNSILMQYSKPYIKKSNIQIQYDGVTHNQPTGNSTIYGMMQPLTSADYQNILNLGYTIDGKQAFYFPGLQSRLVPNDIIIDSNDVEWVILPIESDWLEHGNYIKYIIERKIIH